MLTWLRRGTWHPTRGTWSPVLFAIQVIGLGQALLRGSDYVRTPGDGPADLAALTPPPLWVWGCLFCAFAVAGLIGIVGHWGNVVAVGHCGVALAYLCVAFALLQASHVNSWWRVAAGVALAVIGILLARKRPDDPRAFMVIRLVAVLFLLFGALGVIDGMGHDYRGATGQLSAAGIHAVIGGYVLRAVTRQRIRARLPDPL